MNVREIIEKHYLIIPISIKETTHGSGSTYLIQTKDKKYIAKFNNRKAFINLYTKIEPTLNKKGLQQAKIMPTRSGDLMVDDFVLYEYISGATVSYFNAIQKENAIDYMKKYHEIIKDIPIKQHEIPFENHWDKLISIDFIYNELTNRLKDDLVHKSINLLYDRRTFLESLPKQLIHTDLGEDNFLLEGNKILSIIDFTPGYHHILYAFSQFIYWNELWINENPTKEKLRYYLKRFKGHREHEEIYFLFLIQAALSRILGPLMVNPERNIEKRREILQNIMNCIGW